MVEQRRSYTPEEKLKIVLEGLSGTIQISDLCKKYGIKSARYYYWKEELINVNVLDNLHYWNEGPCIMLLFGRTHLIFLIPPSSFLPKYL